MEGRGEAGREGDKEEKPEGRGIRGEGGREGRSRKGGG